MKLAKIAHRLVKGTGPEGDGERGARLRELLERDDVLPPAQRAIAEGQRQRVALFQQLRDGRLVHSCASECRGGEHAEEAEHGALRRVWEIGEWMFGAEWVMQPGRGLEGYAELHAANDE